MAHEPIISVSGLRGIVGETLTPDVAFRYAAAFAATLPPGPLLVTRDGRANGPGAGRARRGGAFAKRHTTRARRRHRRDADDRRAGPAAPMRRRHPDFRQPQSGRIQRDEAVFGRGPRRAGECRRGGAAAVSDAGCGMRDARYPASSIQHPASRRHDVPRISRSSSESSTSTEFGLNTFRVLLDANHGSGSVLGRPLLERLGCDVILLGGEAGWPVRAPAGADGRESGHAC